MSSPRLSVGGESALGYVIQPAFGTPEAVPASATPNAWVQQLSNTLAYDVNRHGIKVGGGSRGTLRKFARGQTKSNGDVELLLQINENANLIAYALGTDTFATGEHVLTASEPRLLTLEDQRGGVSYQIQDAKIDTLELTSSANDWKLKATILAGQETRLAAQTAPTYGADETPLQWGDVMAITLPGGVTPDDVDSFSLTVKNMLKQWFGGGQYTATRNKSTDFDVSGKFSLLFDTDAAASAYAGYVAGTETTLGLTIGHDATHKHVIALPQANLTKAPKKYALNDFITVDVEFQLRDPLAAFSWSIYNDDATGY